MTGTGYRINQTVELSKESTWHYKLYQNFAR
jgi:hypothetical protein